VDATHIGFNCITLPRFACISEAILSSIRSLARELLLSLPNVQGQCYGLELDPLYVDTIIRRWQRQTKLEAIHVETKETFNSRDNARDR
jgi:hypothetical protein